MLQGSISDKTKQKQQKKPNKPKKPPTKTAQLLPLEKRTSVRGRQKAVIIIMMPVGFVPWPPYSCSAL